jgi:TolB-like protein/DNA-binding winged helix-turn-helix (wHTH) protein/Tfp pilus assembly protein PilF
MVQSVPHSRLVRFGVFELNPRTGELRRSGLRVKLQEQPLQILMLLLDHPGELVTREELRDRLWPSDTFVDFEHGLNNAVKKLRLALGDDSESPRFIETVPRRGYCFVAPVESEATSIPQSPVADQVSTQAAEVQSPSQSGLRRRFRIASGVLLAVAASSVVIFLGRYRPFSRAKPPAGKIMLAVLPFDNLTGDPAQDYFSDGMTEELITQLGRLDPEHLGVIARASAMQYKHTGKDIREVGNKLGVNYVLEGSARTDGDRVRITAQLIQVSDQTHLWAEEYDQELRDVLAVEGQVARSIAWQIELNLSTREKKRLATTRIVSPEAYRDYLRGQYAWNKRDPTSLGRALGFFQQSIAEDPAYAPAYAGLADTYALLGAAGYDVLPITEAMEKARAASMKALEIDDTLSEGHASLAFVFFSYDWNWKAAEKEFKRAFALNASNATAHQWYSEYLSALGRSDQSMAEATSALALDPLSLIVNENVARPYYFSRQFDRAIEFSQKTLQLDPSFPIAHLRLGRAYAAKGMYLEASDEFLRFSDLTGGSTLALASLANVRGRMGNRREFPDHC